MECQSSKVEIEKKDKIQKKIELKVKNSWKFN